MKKHRSKRFHLKKRQRAERRFQWYGIVAVSLAICALVFLLTSIATGGFSAFQRTVVAVDVPVAEFVKTASDERSYYSLITSLAVGIIAELDGIESAEVSRDDKKAIRKFFSGQASDELKREIEDLETSGQVPSFGTTRFWLTASSDIDLLFKGQVERSLSPIERRVTDKQLKWMDQLEMVGRIQTVFNTYFFTHADSRDAEQAGVAGALVGSCFTILICLLLTLPVGIAAAIYLEEFAPKNWITEFIEININNLAAVPSIIFGLLGLAVFLNVFGLPRSASLVGGCVLALMTLPTIIIACRASLRAVPSSIRDGALALGASKTQAVLQNVLPLAIPGTLTGTIIGLARALGETAPLLMIGMVAFIADVPETPLEPSTVLPVQIFLWAESAERGFHEKTSAAIVVILIFLFVMNSLAVLIRNRMEKKW